MDEVSKRLGLTGKSVGKTRHWQVAACSPATGEGLLDAFRWVLSDVASQLLETRSLRTMMYLYNHSFFRNIAFNSNPCRFDSPDYFLFPLSPAAILFLMQDQRDQ